MNLKLPLLSASRAGLRPARRPLGAWKLGAARWFQLSTVTRMSLGLSSLVVMALLVLDFLVGIVPAPVAAEKASRQVLSEMLSVQVAGLAARGAHEELGALLRDSLKRVPGLQAVGVRQANGKLLHTSGDYLRQWQPLHGGQSTVTHISVPISRSGQPWGALELVYQLPAGASVFGVMSWLEVLWPGAAYMGCFALFHVYLRRVLKQLDPNSAVPERVRSAYDALAEGIVILDAQAHVVLANSAFRAFDPLAPELLGKPLDAQAWLAPAVAQLGADVPWARCLRLQENIERQRMAVEFDGVTRTFFVSCTPVKDGRGQVRGCLVAFLDRTEVERSHEELQLAMERLQWSAEEIRKKNEELVTLASRDGLTGCLNRRAFFESAGTLVQAGLHGGTQVACVMTDVDHFKGFNDRYGHAVGDKVLQAVAKRLMSGLREPDQLCRYGGEEFCILLPGCDLEHALQVAERLRAAIEETAGASLRAAEPLRVTSSFGVAVLEPGVSDIEVLVDRADQALYRAKRSGRNRVEHYGNLAVSPV